MAISKVDTGVFLVSPDKVDFKNSLAYEYTQVFTKARQDQWEMAQKQALMEMELGAKKFAAEMETYRARLRDIADHNKAIDLAIADIKEGRLKAGDAARIEAMKEAGRRQRTLMDFEKAKAEQMQQPKGGRSESTSTGGGRGGGGGGPGGRPTLSDVEQMEIGGAVSTSSGDPAVAAVDLKGRRQAGSLVATAAEDADIQNAALIDNLVTQRTNSGVDRDQALADVRDELDAAGHGDIVDSWDRVDDARKEAQAGGGGTSRESRSFNYGSRSVPKYEGLTVIPPAPTVEPPAVAGDTEAIKALEALKLQSGEVAAPTLPMMDYITRSREVAAGRFGPTYPTPAFQQRNALDALMRLGPEERQRLVEAYRARVPAAAAPAAPTTPTATTAAPAAPTAPAAPPTAAEAPVDPNYFREPVLGFEAAPPRRFGESGMGETFPYEEAIRAAESGPQRPPAPAPEALPAEPAEPRIAPTPAAPPAPEPYVEDAETIALRKKAMAAVRAREFAAKQAELQALMDKRAADRGLVSGMLSPLSGLSTAMPTVPTMTAPPQPQPRALPAMAMPQVQAAPVPPIGIDTSRAAELALLGVKPEGELMQVAPPTLSAALAAPRTAAEAPAGYLSSSPLRGQSPEMITAGTNILERKAARATEEAAAAGVSKDVAAARKAGVLGATKTPEQQWMDMRLTAAQTLAKQPEKLARLRSSEAGKLADQYYQAEKAAGYSVMHTVNSTLKNELKDKPELRDRVTELVLALALKDLSDTNPK